jgi:dihydrofolate synthase/folylpolyglutamate synthase
MALESYEQALEFLYRRVNFERMAGAQYGAGDFKLDRMRALLERLGNPHLGFPVVHLAGTKGKGSTAAMIAAMLSAAGLRAGLFTSPHISAFEERMSVGGVVPSAGQLVELMNAVVPAVNQLDALTGAMAPTYFEITTALAWLYFRQAQAEIAVLEVGMGGRLDATNLCAPVVCVITSISRDHTRQLGSRIEQIAQEKAGIIKPGVPVVSGVADPAAREVIARVCSAQGATLAELDQDFHVHEVTAPLPCASELPARQSEAGSIDVHTPRRKWLGLPLPLIGSHQARNAALAVAAVENLIAQGYQISEGAVREGLSNLRWPGRIEMLARRPTVIVDAAHNWAAIKALVNTLEQCFAGHHRRLLIFAATRDKDVHGMLRLLLPSFECVILTAFQNNPRAVPVTELARLARSMTAQPLHVSTDAASAWKLARRLAGPNDLVCVTGSFFIAAELRELILDAAGAPFPSELTNPLPIEQAHSTPPVS